MNLRLKAKPIASVLLSMALCATMAMAQNSTSSDNTNLPDLVELDPFGGVSLFGQVNHGLGTKFIAGGAWGGRAAVNVSDHIGIELSYQYLANHVRFITPLAPGQPTYDFPVGTHDFALNPVYNFTPRGSRVRPYLTAGIGGADFVPLHTNRGILNSGQLNDNLQVAFNYGGGVKFHISEHFGLRLDLRGFLSRNPTFVLPNYPNGGIYIPRHDKLNGVQATIGLIWYAGRKAQEAAPAAAPSVVPPPPLSAGSITGGEGTLCQGKAITLHSTASDPAGHQLAYAWKLNGNPQGSNSADFSFTPNNAGDFQVEVDVTDTTDANRKVSSGPVTLSVKEYTEPVISSFSVTPRELSCKGENSTSQLTVAASGSACGGNLTYKWTVSEGSVSNDSSANANFDAKTLNFDQSSGQTQTKSVTATVTITDETGKSVTKSDTISVKCEPEVIRLSDIVFPKNNSRINNCGKRILVDEVPAKLTDPNYNVYLVGHIDKDEAKTEGRRGRRAARALDEARALNAAAVLTGGSGTCAKVDPSRVFVDWVGDDQTSEAQPGLCGSSTRQATKERRSSQVSDSDKFRRVEVYIVPKGSQPPAAVKNAKPLPEKTMKALGCPK